MSNARLTAHLQRHEACLANLIVDAQIPAPLLKEAMLYTLFPGGKRIRPCLVYLCGDLLAVDFKILDILAAAIELTHTYSLVHDDLPAMDNDDYRRGKLSCHRAFDEATAILVGDGLQAFAIEVLLTHLPPLLPSSKVINVTHALLQASGPNGMLSGQSLDLSELALGQVHEGMLLEIHHLKTGKLMLACINMVLAASQATPCDATDLQQFAHHLGLVFQMQDDYLDRYGSNDSLGKGRSSDLANNKTTFATLQTQEALFNTIQLHFQKADLALSRFGSRAADLQALIQSLMQRTPLHASNP